MFSAILKFHPETRLLMNDREPLEVTPVKIETNNFWITCSKAGANRTTCWPTFRPTFCKNGLKWNVGTVCCCASQRVGQNGIWIWMFFWDSNVVNMLVRKKGCQKLSKQTEPTCWSDLLDNMLSGLRRRTTNMSYINMFFFVCVLQYLSSFV